MAVDLEDDIVQDFLVEAGEILERLNEQLVELEQSPDDTDLLNAIFRGFHTIKGGAGFLNLENLVTVCHRSEDVFNLLRQGQLHLDADMMDIFLQVLDVLNSQFDEVRGGNDPSAATPQLIGDLERLLNPNAAPPPAPAPVAPAAVPEAPAAAPASGGEAGGDITDQEFEALLDQLDGTPAAAAPAAPVAPAAAAESDEITEEEFEALLDQLHGEGRGPTPVVGEEAPPAPAQPAAPAPAAAGSEEITEAEFEALLDQLHGEGKGPTATATMAVPAAPPAAPAAVPAEPPPAAAAPPKPPAKAPPGRPATGGKPTGDQSEATVRVDTKRLDDIMNLVGELVLVRNRMSTLRSTFGDDEVSKVVANLDLVTADLQSAVMKTRMQPIKKVFGRFPRVVRDLARSLKKEVQLELQGEETEVDKNLVEALADPLVHLVRNAVDHGVEGPEEREAAGKKRVGHVVLAADQEGDHILLTISDDGKGMDPDILRSKAVEKGLMDEDAAGRLSDQEAFSLIFAPGFSTKTEISDVSGRGVGMDVVKTRITQLNGSIEIDSRKGKGSTLRIKVPLTLAIMPTLMVVLGKQTFALPLASVSEIFDLDLSKTNVVDGQPVVLVRDKTLPLFYLRKWLVKGAEHTEYKKGDTGHVVVVQAGNQRIGFVVDHLIGQEEVVIKPLGALLQGQAGMAGATITGDGGIALILDVPSLLKAYAGKF
ncbi:chemotaxis protein CheA [Endothiovibrio diazotrophicus]